MTVVLKRLGWVIIAVAPLLFWFEIHRARTTDYDENFAHFFAAVIVSIINAFLLYKFRKDISSTHLKRIIAYFSILSATPLTVSLLIIYAQNFQMRFISSGYMPSSDDGKRYYIEKRRNSFKAENTLVLDYAENPDTIKAIVRKDGAIERVVKFKQGQERIMEPGDVNALTSGQQRELLKY